MLFHSLFSLLLVSFLQLLIAGLVRPSAELDLPSFEPRQSQRPSPNTIEFGEFPLERRPVVCLRAASPANVLTTSHTGDQQLFDKSPLPTNGEHHVHLVKRHVPFTDWEELKVLHVSKYDNVILVQHVQSKKLAVMKQARLQSPSENRQYSLTHEIEMTKAAKGHYVVAVYDEYHQDGETAMLLEYVNGGDLFEAIRIQKPPSEENALYLFWKMSLAVAALHQNGIIHHDIKLENFFINVDAQPFSYKSVTPKLGDFAYALDLNNEKGRPTHVCGSFDYIAPEMLDRDGEVPFWKNQKATDIYSLGAAFLYTMRGKYLYKLNKRPLYIVIPESLKVSSTLRDLMKCMLRHRARTRCSIQDVLNHDFFKRSKVYQELIRMTRLL